MRINNNNIDVNEAINFVNMDNMLYKHRKNGFYLNDFQIEVLGRYGINYEEFNNMNDLLFEIMDTLNDEYDSELDLVSSQIAELVYYKDTKK